jgi:hypothetical protein
MNTKLTARLCSAAVLAALAFSPAIVSAKERSDAARDLLGAQGTVAIDAAGPYVERGTFQVQVTAKLGRPDFVLADGTWQYRNRAIEGRDVQGTLVVRFTNGRVSALSLVTPAVALAMRSPAKQADKALAQR